MAVDVIYLVYTMGMRTTQKTYQFRMEPTKKQEQQLLQFAGARRWVWNWALDRKRTHYKTYRTGLRYIDLAAELTALKAQPGTTWLRDMDSQALQQALRDLEQAFTNFFEHRARFPRFKAKKRDAARFRIPQRVTVHNGQVYIPKIGRVRIRQHRVIAGKTKSATFKLDAAGHWQVTLVAVVELPEWLQPSPTPETTVGVDAGLKEFAVLSTGERIANPRFARRQERVLRRANRNLSRKQQASRNRGRARARLARLHRRIANQRGAFLHQQSRRLIDRFQAVAIEDLNVRTLAKSKLSRSFADAPHGRFRSLLTYKADWYGKQLVVIDRFFPSSKRCSACGHVHANLQLGDRFWRCVCGAEHDRDLNAAVNIQQAALHVLAVGCTESQNACGQPVRRATARMAG